ncbi:hypothetical protein [Endozoicomonas montiporae]|nr:hypothetical protein [Endozoicomonas montiporae]
MLKANVEGNDLIIRVNREYLKNSTECALTTGTEKTVMDEEAMMAYFAQVLTRDNDDSPFNCCLDQIADEAYEAGEHWLVSDYELQHSS